MKKKDTKLRQPITIDYENKKLSVIYFMPLLLIAGFVPLIVYAKYVDLEGTTQALYWTGQRQYLDFFSYWKAQWVVILTAIALMFYIILFLREKLPLKNLKQYYIPLGIYAIFVIISTIFAIDKPTALWGFVDMYQGMFVLLSYVTITFLTINFVNSERDVKLFAKAFTILMIIEGLLGITQYFGFDFFQTKIGNSLIIPGNLQVENLSFSFGPKTIYGTLFNTNFVGSFATLMLPLSVAFLLGAKTKKQKIVSAIAAVLTIFTWLGCNSRAGYLGVAVSAVFGVWLFRKVIIKNWKSSVCLIVIFVIMLFGLNFASDGILFKRIQTFNVVEQIQTIKDQNKKALRYEEIVLGKETFSIKTNLNTLNFKIDNDKVYFMDDSKKELEISQKGNELTINDDRYRNYKITIPENYPGITVAINWHIINFYISESGVKVIGSGGRLTKPIIAERLEMFDGIESLAANRGYIWGRTIPLLYSYLYKGAGADNYPYAFPQDDFIGKLNANWDWDANLVIDKPHNLYLQVAINTGLFSLLALLVALGIYFINSLKLYSKMIYNSFEKYLGASCLISVIGYLVSGMFNDSVISVAPIFWIILGLGISINLRLKNKTS